MGFPHFRQTTAFSCGAACCKIVLFYRGFVASEVDLMRALHTSPVTGTTPARIAEVLSGALGQRVLVESMTLDRLRHCLREQAPVIVLLQAWGNPTDAHANTDGHYAVVFGLDDHHVWFSDPADDADQNVLPVGEFLARWHDVDDQGRLLQHIGIAVFPKG